MRGGAGPAGRGRGALNDSCAAGPGVLGGSGDGGDASVGVEQVGGGWPVLEEPDDVAAGESDREGAAGGVPEPTAQCLGFGGGEGAGEAEQLEPADEVGGEAHGGHPRPVGVKVGEGEPFEAGGFQSADVVLDMGVDSHVGVQDGGVAGLVGVVAPVAELQRGEQAGLGSGVERLAAHDQPGARRPTRQVDQVGDLDDRGAVALVAVLSEGGDPAGGLAVVEDPADRGGDGPVGAGGHREADVAFPEPGGKGGRAGGRVGPDPQRSGHAGRVVAGPVAGSDPGGELVDRRVEDREVVLD